MSRVWAAVAAAWMVAFALGCASGTPLMPAPRIYTGDAPRPLFTSVDPAAQPAAIDLLYVTNRAPSSQQDASLPYGSERSQSLAFGSVKVEVDPELDGEAFAAESVRAERDTEIEVTLGEAKELGRFPPIPYAVEVTETGLRRASPVMDVHEKAAADLRAEAIRRLAQVPRKELVLYVHGYANTFEDAALTMGEICHFLGREFLCAIFSWPAAGDAGLLAGYEVDYESSAFSVQHLKQSLRLLTEIPGLERVHLLAHSRGTGLLSSALRELGIEAYVAGDSLAARYKVKNIVLAAPDMDVQVAGAKIFGIASDPGMPFGGAPNPRGEFPPMDLRVTVYASKGDKALSASELIFGSALRLGRADVDEFTPQQAAQAARQAFLVDIVEVRHTPGLIGHSYFKDDPDASADLISVIRYGLAPGEPGRPLKRVQPPFWRVVPPDDR